MVLGAQIKQTQCEKLLCRSTDVCHHFICFEKSTYPPYGWAADIKTPTQFRRPTSHVVRSGAIGMRRFGNDFHGTIRSFHRRFVNDGRLRWWWPCGIHHWNQFTLGGWIIVRRCRWERYFKLLTTGHSPFRHRHGKLHVIIIVYVVWQIKSRAKRQATKMRKVRLNRWVNSLSY